MARKIERVMLFNFPLLSGHGFLASLCETDSPGTGEVALEPEGEQWPAGPEGENLATVRNISGHGKALSPTRCGGSPLTEGAKELFL